ncbi:FG-GAP-like repeat-containing protein [Streptomyces sp. NPDC093225]|uniref:FG-GAP-like repeat-containing protein n=1 Tax=Streptomyces sp. NPDC093225 TaxID=3366034 RepID=UPI00382F4637
MRMRAMGAIGLSAATALTAAALSPVTATAAPGSTVAATATATAISTAAAPAKHRTYADYNGDGYPDLAISASEATVGTVEQAGAVAVAYGSATGIGKAGTRLVTQTDANGTEAPDPGGRWGRIQGFGDLDGDGLDDLVVMNARGDGRIWVLWGSKQGLSGSTLLAVTASTTPHALDPWWVDVGDTDGDGIADLVGTITRMGPSTYTEAGFGIVRGPVTRSGGFKPVRYRETLRQDGTAPRGFVIADFTGDGRPDMGAISANPWKQNLMVYKGTATGWTASRQIALPGTRYMWMQPEIGDINGDGAQDMVLGHRRTYTDPLGKIFVAYGGKDGFSTTLTPRRIDQDTPGVPGPLERYDSWGEARSLADVDKDGYADLAVGAEYKDAQGGTVRRAGSVTLLRGGKQGLTTAGARTITQNTAGVPSTSEEMDRFGAAVAWVDGDRNGIPELYVGGPGEDKKVGRVWQLPAGTGTGATSFNLKETGHPSGQALFGEQFAG